MRKGDMRLRIQGSRDRIVTDQNERKVRQRLLSKYPPDTVVECFDYKGEFMELLTLCDLYGEKKS